MIPEDIKAEFLTYFNLEETDFKIIESKSIYKYYSENTIIIKPSQHSKKLHFILQGFGKMYIIDEYGEEKFLYLSDNTRVLTSINGFLRNKPSNHYVEIEKNSHLLSIDANVLEKLVLTNKNLTIWYFSLLKRGLEYTTFRLEGLLTNSAEKRYTELLNKEPQLIGKALRKQIATFLGITPNSLSRIISKKK